QRRVGRVDADALEPAAQVDHQYVAADVVAETQIQAVIRLRFVTEDTQSALSSCQGGGVVDESLSTSRSQDEHQLRDADGQVPVSGETDRVLGLGTHGADRRAKRN